MKKFISTFLTMALIVGALSCISVSAQEKYPPFETRGHYGGGEFDGYEFETPGENPTPITLNESRSVQLQLRKNPIPINDEELEKQIREDFANEYYSSDTDLNISYYGTLSDGSMLISMAWRGIYQPVIDYTVIDEYVYVTHSRGSEIKLYKDHQFKSFDEAYLDGSLTDAVLDELAVTLSFAKFVNPNEVKESPTATADTATADTSANNANGSIPTGVNNSVIMLSIIALAVSSFAFCVAKIKN